VGAKRIIEGSNGLSVEGEVGTVAKAAGDVRHPGRLAPKMLDKAGDAYVCTVVWPAI
jgi:hypothetical protein